MFRWLIALLLVVSMGCQTPPEAVLSSNSANLPPPPALTNIVVDAYHTGHIRLSLVRVGSVFNQKEREMAFNSSMFVKSLVGDKTIKPDFSKYYWTEDLPDNIWGLTRLSPKTGEPHFILINKKLFPTGSVLSVQEFFNFGVTVNHEWLHYYHRLNHPQVQMICDWPAKAGFQEFLRSVQTNSLTIPEG